MRYTTLLFDLDHTLFDFDASESAAFSKTLATAGIDDPDRYRDMFAAINTALWADVESGVLSPNEVRTRRFCNLIDGAGIDADPLVLADHYVIGLGAEGDLYAPDEPLGTRYDATYRIGDLNEIADIVAGD